MKLFFTILASCLCSCAYQPVITPEIQAKIDDPASYGPMPNNYKKVVRTFVENKSFDPTAVLIEFQSPPVKGYYAPTNFFMEGPPLNYGYWVQAKVNGKNRFGGYAGAETYRFLLRHNSVLNVCKVNAYGGNDCGANGMNL